MGVVLCSLLLLRRGSVIRWSCLWLFLGVCSSAATVAKPLTELPGHQQSVTVVITDWPRYPRPGLMRVSLEARAAPSATQGGTIKASCDAVHLPWRNMVGVKAGDTLTLVAQFDRIESSLNPFTWDASLRRRGYSARCKILWATPPDSKSQSRLQRLQSSWRMRLRGITGDAELGGMIRSLLLGERDTLSIETEEAFKTLGLSHLLVISGYQIVLVFALTHALLSASLWRTAVDRLTQYSSATLGALLTSGLLCALTDFEGSCSRAMITLIVHSYAERSGYSRSLWAKIIVSLFAVSVLWPAAILDPGTQLTFAALGGLALGSRYGAPEPRWRSALRSCLLASCATASISALWFGQASPMALVLNPTLAPIFSTVFCYGGMLALATSYLSYSLTSWLMSGLLEIARITRALVWALSEIPYASIEAATTAQRIALSIAFFVPVGIAIYKRLREWCTLMNCR